MIAVQSKMAVAPTRLPAEGSRPVTQTRFMTRSALDTTCRQARRHVTPQSVKGRNRRQRINDRDRHHVVPRRVIVIEELLQRHGDGRMPFRPEGACTDRSSRSKRTAARKCRPRRVRGPSAAQRLNASAAPAEHSADGEGCEPPAVDGSALAGIPRCSSARSRRGQAGVRINPIEIRRRASNKIAGF